MADDVYDDPDNILADDDDVDGAGPEVDDTELSQSPLLPEKDASDSRGMLDEVDPDSDLNETEDDLDHPEDADPDANRLSDVNSPDEHDGTEG